MLYIVGGLPGTGKTTISQRLARERGAVHLRIDVIEQALRDAGVALNGPEGYIVAYRLAEHFLRMGQSVVADCVNPIQLTRSAWRAVAGRAGVPFVEIVFVCSDPVEHRRRVEERAADIEGFRLPTWEDVTARAWEPWDGDPIVINTAGETVDESLAKLRVLV